MLTLEDVGLDMHQDGEDLYWEMETGDVLVLDREDLEQLIYRLSDELHAMDVTYRGYAAPRRGEYDLPEGTDMEVDDLVGLDGLDDDFDF